MWTIAQIAELLWVRANREADPEARRRMMAAWEELANLRDWLEEHEKQK